MLNILDYIRDLFPNVYERTKFKVIEISSSLASLQTSRLRRSASSRGHTDHVEIINRSIFDWDTYVPSPCYFLALEVFDNFAHDGIRYDPFTEEPLQGTVLIDNHGDFYEFYTPTLDPVASRFLQVRNAACSRIFDHPLRSSRLMRNIRSRLPFAGNLTVPEYIPTRLMQFFDILHTYFPLHRLVASDFHSLPDTIKGVNAPVVQTRYQRRTVPVSTPLVSCLFSPSYSSFFFFSKFPLPFLSILETHIDNPSGPTRLLRHHLPYRLRRHRRHLPRHDRQIDGRVLPRRLPASMGVCREYGDQKRRESAVDLVQERKRYDNFGGK